MQSSSAQIAQLTRSHEARLEYEVRQAKAQVDMAADRVQASEAQAQLRLQEQKFSPENSDEFKSKISE